MHFALPPPLPGKGTSITHCFSHIMKVSCNHKNTARGLSGRTKTSYYRSRNSTSRVEKRREAAELSPQIFYVHILSYSSPANHGVDTLTTHITLAVTPYSLLLPPPSPVHFQKHGGFFCKGGTWEAAGEVTGGRTVYAVEPQLDSDKLAKGIFSKNPR